MIIKAVNGQNFFDIVLQYYGTLDNLSDFLADNKNTDLNVNITSGQELIINDSSVFDETIKNEYIKTEHITNNQDENFISIIEQKEFEDGELFYFENEEPFEFN